MGTEHYFLEPHSLDPNKCVIPFQIKSEVNRLQDCPTLCFEKVII